MSLPPSFLTFMVQHFSRVPKAMAIAVSGGGDSMALAMMLLEWRRICGQKIEIHILTVDHGFRPEAKQEVAFVAQSFAEENDVVCKSFTASWDEGLPQSAIMKQARQMRYALMQDYCHTHGITHLFLAHHRDDQTETFLIRLAKGSGIDGLAGMRDMQLYDKEGLYLVRPLLDISHEDLLNYCRAQDMTWAEDPTNENLSYTRNRLRASRGILAEEGLSAVRLRRVAMRCGRARDALEYFTRQALTKVMLEEKEESLTLDFFRCQDYPDEIIVRLFLHAYDRLCPDKYYRPRFEKLENMVNDILRLGSAFKPRTLGGLKISLRDRTLRFEKERSNTE